MGDRREARRALRGRLIPGIEMDPYHAIGLERNPFTAEEMPGVPASLWIDRGVSEAPTPAAGMLVQIIGPRGAGKTSHLLHWRDQHDGPYRYIPASIARWRQPPIAPIAYWDEADRLPSPLLRLALRRAFRRGSTIVAAMHRDATHRDLEVVARRAGLDVRTIRIPPLDARTLLSWAEERIASCRIMGTTVAPPIPDIELLERVVELSEESLRTAGIRLHVWMAEAACYRPSGYDPSTR